MANRIDNDYFTGFRSLPNLNEDTEAATLTASITRLEPKFFIDVFGYEFQALMLADPTNVIYEPILNGVVFRDVNDIQHEWEGINESIANYVYFYHTKENYINNSGAGYNVGANSNSTMVQPITEPVRVWNYMNPALEILKKYLIVNEANYPTLIFSNFEKLNTFGF